MSFQCTLVTPEQQVLDETVTQVILPAHDGLVGIETDRAPLLVKLGVGPLRIDLESRSSQHYLVEGGVAQMKDNKLTILTQKCTPAGEIDMATINAELAEATARTGNDEKTRQEREDAQRRVSAARQLAGKS